jgi:hypothetical protein
MFDSATKVAMIHGMFGRLQRRRRRVIYLDNPRPLRNHPLPNQGTRNDHAALSADG